MSTKSPNNLPRIVVLVSGGGSNLQAIIDGVERGQIPATIAAVISNRADAGGLVRAQHHNIPAEHVDHRQFSDRADFDRALIQQIDKHSPDLVVLAGFMRILSEEFTEHYLGKMLNIHPSLLPKYKGLNTHQRALDNGDKIHGASVHFVTAELDGGPIVIQGKVLIEPEDNKNSLAEKVLQQEHRIYPLAIAWFVAGRLKMTHGKCELDGNPYP